MSEGIPRSPERGPTRKEQIIALALELHERKESFPFSGIDSGSYSKMKATEEEYPGYTTPVDEIIERMKSEGMKVVLGKNPQSGNVYVLPSGSDNIEMDSISPGQLETDDGMDERLAKLISLTRG